MIESGDWGPVRVTGGRHRGKLGYYDDDASEKTAIVYLGAITDGYTLIRRSCLDKADAPTEFVEHYARQWPTVVKMLGMVVRR